MFKCRTFVGNNSHRFLFPQNLKAHFTPFVPVTCGPILRFEGLLHLSWIEWSVEHRTTDCWVCMRSDTTCTLLPSASAAAAALRGADTMNNYEKDINLIYIFTSCFIKHFSSGKRVALCLAGFPCRTVYRPTGRCLREEYVSSALFSAEIFTTIELKFAGRCFAKPMLNEMEQELAKLKTV